MGLQWYVGVDWGKLEHQVCLLDATGKQQAERKVAHCGAGFAQTYDSSVLGKFPQSSIMGARVKLRIERA